MFLANVNRQALALIPPITPILLEAEGGIATVFSAMRMSQDPTIVKFLREYDKSPEIDRQCLPLEVWILKAKVEPNTLLGEIIFALREQSVNVVKVIAMTSHPDVVRARIKNAKTPKGYRDRDALDTALGLLPTPKGTTIIGKYFAGGTPEPAKDPPGGARPDETDVDDLFPDLESTQMMLTDGQ